jgi:hypothetical protein
MLYQLMNFILTHRVNSLSLNEFVKNFDAPCSIVVKGVAINGEQRQGVRTGISCKSMFSYGF